MAARVLVMVLAYDAEPWRTIEADGQRATWAGPAAGSPVLWLHGVGGGPGRFAFRAASAGLRRAGGLAAAEPLARAVGRRSAAGPVRRVGDRIVTRVPETYAMANAKTVAGFRHVLRAERFDFLLRTNSSTYVDLAAVQRHVDGLPTTRYYGGTAWRHEGLEYATGTSILLSRDLVEHAASDPGWDFGTVDDVALGRSMRAAGVPLDRFRRCDVATAAELAALTADDLRGALVVRCRGADDRSHDVRAMRRVHALLGRTAEPA